MNSTKKSKPTTKAQSLDTLTLPSDALLDALIGDLADQVTPASPPLDIAPRPAVVLHMPDRHTSPAED